MTILHLASDQSLGPDLQAEGVPQDTDSLSAYKATCVQKKKTGRTTQSSLEPRAGLEPTTFRLQGECSTK